MKHIQQYLKATLGVAFMAGSLVFTSCESDVIDLSPVNSLTDETAYATAERCKLSLIGAYDAAQCGFYNDSYSRGYPLGSAIIMQGEMRGEDMVNRAAFFQYTYESTINASSSLNNITFWNASFEAINRINVVIAGEKQAAENGVIDASTAAQYDGELKFLRGVIYHYLMVHFAMPYNLPNDNNGYGLPIHTEPINTMAGIEAGVSTHRSSVADTYAQIVKDLTEAAEELPATNSDNNITRATKGAAYAMLSRIYLHMREWDKVIEMNDKVKACGYELESDPITPFNNYTTNSESIFSCENSANDNGSVNGAMFSMFSCRSGARYLVSMSPILVNDTRWLQDDKRRSEYILSSEDAESSIASYDYQVYFCDKFRSSTREDYTPVLRLAEVTLNTAEAYARKGDISSAVTYLNEVRNRALADPATQAYKASDFADKKAAVEAILFERRVEFLGEGIRWNDIHRLAADDLCPTGGIPAKVKWTAINGKGNNGFGVEIPARTIPAYPTSDRRFLWPIPVGELLYNDVLTAEQNQGW